MDLKVDVFEKIAGTFTAAVYLQNLYIKYLRIWISCWRRERERERRKRECWVKLAYENFMDPEFRSF